MGWLAEQHMLQNEGIRQWAAYTDNEAYVGPYAITHPEEVEDRLMRFMMERARRASTANPMSDDEEKHYERLALCGSKKELARVQKIIEEVSAPPPPPPSGGRFERLPKGFPTIVGWIQQCFTTDDGDPKNVTRDSVHRFSVSCTMGACGRSFTLVHGWCSPLEDLVLHIERKHDIITPEVPDWSGIHGKQIVPSPEKLREYYREYCRETGKTPNWDVPQEGTRPKKESELATGGDYDDGPQRRMNRGPSCSVHSPVLPSCKRPQPNQTKPCVHSRGNGNSAVKGQRIGVKKKQKKLVQNQEQDADSDEREDDREKEDDAEEQKRRKQKHDASAPASSLPPCAQCGKVNAPERCSVCKVSHYCNRECQVANWKVHKKECKK